MLYSQIPTFPLGFLQSNFFTHTQCIFTLYFWNVTQCVWIIPVRKLFLLHTSLFPCIQYISQEMKKTIKACTTCECNFEFHIIQNVYDETVVALLIFLPKYDFVGIIVVIFCMTQKYQKHVMASNVAGTVLIFFVLLFSAMLVGCAAFLFLMLCPIIFRGSVRNSFCPMDICCFLYVVSQNAFCSLESFQWGFLWSSLLEKTLSH